MSLNKLIEEFNIENYEECNKENITLINNFLEIYNKIEQQDNKTPLFSLTNKYNAYKLRKSTVKKKIWKSIIQKQILKRLKQKLEEI